MLASAVDLFCGAGGLTRGFMDEGLPVEVGIDMDPNCRYPFERNNKGARFLLEDVARLPVERVASLFAPAEARVLAGCAPCQSFSTYTQRLNDYRQEDWGLLRKFAEIAGALRPDVVTMENVPQLAAYDVYDDFVAALESEGYVVTKYDVFCPEYGIPQIRKRLVLLASLHGRIALAPPTHSPSTHPTVREAISHLEPIGQGETSETDPLHKASGLSKVNFLRMKSSVPGGTWRDWPEELRAECHRKHSGRTYPSVYSRMEWDKPSPTVTTQFYGFGNGRFGHPKQDRGLTLREGALLQTFPKDYVFMEPGEQVSFKRVGRLVGNAVPVMLGRAVARSIKHHLEEVV